MSLKKLQNLNSNQKNLSMRNSSRKNKPLLSSEIVFLTIIAILGIGSQVSAKPLYDQQTSRVSPAKSRGGKALPDAWVKAPPAWKNFPFPEWPLPSKLKQWQETDRENVKKKLINCLGERPARPDPKAVKVLSREDKGDYWQETFEFHNGIDSLVPGILLIPKQSRKRAPAIIGLHAFGGTAQWICTNPIAKYQHIGPTLARKGYVVAAIDTYFNGARSPKGIDGKSPERYRGPDQGSLFRLNMWMGRNLWSLMQRDQQCLIDYLQTRPEVDPEAIGVTGMSMGGTGSWWLAALDERIKVAVSIAGSTRYRELLSVHQSTSHGVYYFVPEVLKHFDTEAIFSLIAPRPLLMLSGDSDRGAPLAGVEILEKKLSKVYSLHKKPHHFHSTVFHNTGHEYVKEMHDEMLQWFYKYLPVEK